MMGDWWFDTGEDWDSPNIESVGLVVGYEEPSPIGVVLGPDGEPILEVHQPREPMGYRHR